MIESLYLGSMNLLELRDYSVAFGQNKPVLHQIRFDIQEGEILGIVGESGSGKSLTALSILQMLPIGANRLSGQCFWYGGQSELRLDQMSEKDLCNIRGKQISMIFQEPLTALNPIFRCGKQVREVMDVHHFLPKEDRETRIKDWFSRVGLDDPDRIYRAYPHELSGGQLQRILIALALCCDPKLLIADEPTTALDVTIQKQIIELLLELKKELGLTVIFISHDLGVIKEIADRVLVIMKGEIVERGPVHEVFSQPQHPYTQGLLNCRPPLKHKLKRLPTVQSFLEQKNVDAAIISRDEQKSRCWAIQNLEPLLTVKSLSVDYVIERNFWGKPRRILRALRPLDCFIRPGETLGVVGESGSGKSTFGKALLKLIPANSGKVLYQEQDILSLSQNALRPIRKDLQIIFQDPYSALNPRMKIGHAITEPMRSHGIHKSSNQRKEAAVALLEEVGLMADHFNRYPHQFSGGQRQRICIARALSVDPRFIVCDESVSALDVSVQAQVLNLFQELKEKRHLSYLFISHDLSVIHFMADHIIVLKSGEVVEHGGSYEIFHNARHPYTRKLLAAIPGASRA